MTVAVTALPAAGNRVERSPAPHTAALAERASQTQSADTQHGEATLHGPERRTYEHAPIRQVWLSLMLAQLALAFVVVASVHETVVVTALYALFVLARALFAQVLGFAAFLLGDTRVRLFRRLHSCY